jgi:hypothetical protein
MRNFFLIKNKPRQIIIHKSSSSCGIKIVLCIVFTLMDFFLFRFRVDVFQHKAKEMQTKTGGEEREERKKRKKSSRILT